MTISSAIRPILWCLCAATTLAIPISGWAQNPPITIPPASQITPPALPPAPSPQGIAPAPRGVLPTSVELVRDPLGAGIVMYGQLSGKADSALAVTSAIFSYSGAFDPVPAPLLATADKDDRSAQTMFTATVRGVKVLGIAVVTLDDTGGNVSVFYDYADSLPGSFPRLLQALGPGGVEAGLASLRLVDGSQISVPPGWRVLGQGKGLVDLGGEQGELISLGNVVSVYAGPTGLAGSVAQALCCDPVKAFQGVFPHFAATAQRRGWPPQFLTNIVDSASITVESSGQGALILATASIAGRAYSLLALAEAIGGFTDPWTLHLSSVAAPQPLFADELPNLLSIWSSYSAQPPDLGEHLKATARSISALQPLLNPAPNATKYRASAGWNDVINAVVARSEGTGNSPIGDKIARSLVDSLAKDSGGSWHVAAWPAR